MFSDELKELIARVLTSWQVIVVTVGIIIYVFIVSSVSRLYHSARPKESKGKGKGKKEKKPKKEKKSAEVTEETDALGLGE